MKQQERLCRVCDGTGEVEIKNGGYDIEVPCDACVGYGTVCDFHGDPECSECFM